MKCSECGHTYVGLKHYPVEDEEVPATCMTSGQTGGTHCSSCGIVLSSPTVLDANPEAHPEESIVIDKGVAPTCTTSGLTQGTHCEMCGNVIDAQQTIGALGHEWGKPVFIWADDNGSAAATTTCTHDGTHKVDADVKVSSTMTLPTASEDGEIIYTAKATFTDPEYSVTLSDEDCTEIKGVTIARGGYSPTTDQVSWIQGSTESAGFHFTRAEFDELTFTLFTGLQVDGVAVSEDMYTAGKGSLTVDLSPSYLATLEEGQHTLTVLFADGSSTATLQVKAPGSNPSGDDAVPAIPNAGDPLSGATLMGMGLILLSSGTMLYRCLRRKA